MPKEAALHESPLNSSAHQSLISEIRNAEFDPEILRNFLWLINAHDRLIAFPRICGNIITIIEEAKATWEDKEIPPILEDAVPVLRWISEQGAFLTTIGPEFNREPKKIKDHPVMNRGSSRHPLYTTLWNTCETENLRHEYRLLQAHLLFAHAKQIEANTTREAYEVYGGQEEWKSIPNSPYPACLAVRELSEARYASTLSNLQVNLDFSEFAQSLEHLPESSTAILKDRLTNLRIFLQKAAGLKNWINRGGSGSHSGAGGAPRVTGFVEVSPSAFMQDLPITDPDDPDQDWGSQSMATDLELTPEKQKDLLELDLSPEEFDAAEILLSGYESSQTGTLAANGAAQLRHVAMENQLFPWGFGLLTIADFGPAFIRMANWVKEQFVDHLDSAGSKDWDKLEAFTLLRIMLFTGSSFERARKILVLPESNIHEDAELAFLKLPDQSHAFQVKAIQPDYKTNDPATDGTDRLRTDYILLPDISTTHAYIKLLLEHRQKSRQGSHDDFLLFHRKLDTLKKNLMALLKEMDPSGRLTPHKASVFLQNRILKVTKGDLCAASLICGEPHPLARVRLFYSVLSAEMLQEIYLKAIRELVDQMLQAGQKQFNVPTAQVQPLPRFVGSRLCPTFDAVRNAVAALKCDFLSARPPFDSPEAHNLYTLLTVWHFVFSTACRAIETPYLPLSEIDPETGIGLFADKDDGTGYKARLIWVPPTVMRLMRDYEAHRIALSQTYPSQAPVFFLLPGRKDSLQEAAVRPKTMMPVMKKYLAYPANFHRRFMRTELLNRGCPMEVVDAWMGHWYFGEEPWGLYSSFSFQDYRTALETYLKPLLDDLGLDGTVDNPKEPLSHERIS